MQLQGEGPTILDRIYGIHRIENRLSESSPNSEPKSVMLTSSPIL
jgi:hypothetical protein